MGPQGVHLAGVTQDGAALNITLEIIAPGVAHVLVQAETDPRRVTLALPAARLPVRAAVEWAADRLRILSDHICLEVELDPFRIAFSGAQGTFLQQDRDTTIGTGVLGVLPCGFSTVAGQRVAFHDSFVCEPDEHFYGFGEKFTDFDKRGQRLEMWNYDAYGVHHEQAYKNVPFYVSSRGYGVFVDSVRRVNFDMAHSNHAAVQIVAPDSVLDYYVIAGPDLHDVIRRYANLVSHPILPPKWSLGTWMSSGFKDDSADAVLSRAASCANGTFRATCCTSTATGRNSAGGRKTYGTCPCSPIRRACSARCTCSGSASACGSTRISGSRASGSSKAKRRGTS